MKEDVQMKFKTSFNFSKQALTIAGWTLSLLLVITLIFNTYQNHIQSQKEYFSSIKDQQNQSAHSASLLLSEVMRPNKELLFSTASQLEQMDLSNIAEIKKLLIERSSGITSVGSFYFGRHSDGKIAYSNSYDLPKDFNATLRPWYKEVFSKQDFTISSPYVDTLTQKLSFSLAVPVYQNNIFKGILGIDIYVDTIQELLKNLEVGYYSNLFIINSSGTIIVHPDPKKIGINLRSLLSDMDSKSSQNIDSLNEYGIYKEILSGRDGTVNFKNYNGKHSFISYYTASELNWKIISHADPEIIRQNLRNIYLSNLSKGVNQILLLFLLIICLISYNQMSKKRELKRLLTYDILTGLPNRNFMEEVFSKEITFSKNKSNLALMIIDIDDFKFINDTLGHNIGDRTLTTIAGILKDNVNKDDLVFRLGSDEFAVLMKNCDMNKAKNTAGKLHSVIYDSPINIDSYSFDLSFSIGVTTLGNTQDFKEFLTLAEVALHNAKDQGKNKVVCLLPEDSTESINKLDRANEVKTLIKKSIKDERFILHFQPIMDLKENKISHYEALVRLYDDKGIIIPPGLFIPMAEKFGLISSIDKWVFKTVLNTLKNNPEMSIFMNISGASLNDNALLEYFESSILESGLSIDNLRLGIEITETAATKNFFLAESWLSKFKALGCLIAIDDFGVGYTSFTYLRTLPVDFIKIDGSFVKSIDSDADHKAIVDAINTLAHTLGKKAIAEFIESESIMKILQDLGVCYGQGYYIGKPSPLN
jgi:diguanylate cyclase (GGDEF)-like protein